MTIRLRTAFFAVLGILILWFLYIERAILTPFVLAAIFAYIFNPIVSFLSEKIRLPRTISVIIIYFLIIILFVLASVSLTKRIANESFQFQQYISDITQTAQEQVSSLPDWARPTVRDTLFSLGRSRLFLSPSLLSLFPQAISRILSFVIFLFSAFYFLKEGRRIIDKFLNFFPYEYKIEIEILIRKIDSVLKSYLRGQLFLVLFMSSVFFITLSLFDVRFALFLAVFSGIAEIIPIIGPIVATTVAGLVTYITQSSNFGFTPLHTAFFVVAIYIIVRQIEDYLVAPYVMGKITKIHPLIILFAALSGSHLFGILGLILAVPIAGIIRILLEFSFDKIHSAEKPQK